MKVFKVTNECVRSYNRSTKGYEFIAEVDTDEEMYNLVANREDSDFYPQEDGTVLTASGNECFDPNYPQTFEFGDYIYTAVEDEDLDEYSDAHIIRAINE